MRAAEGMNHCIGATRGISEGYDKVYTKGRSIIRSSCPRSTPSDKKGTHTVRRIQDSSLESLPKTPSSTLCLCELREIPDDEWIAVRRRHAPRLAASGEQSAAGTPISPAIEPLSRQATGRFYLSIRDISSTQCSAQPNDGLRMLARGSIGVRNG
jgi:hypothetical protein